MKTQRFLMLLFMLLLVAVFSLPAFAVAPPIPEPGTIALVGIGLVGVVAFAIVKKRKK
jgi:threonine dehydrogenase-like Zn-dependent dehydrogenase